MVTNARATQNASVRNSEPINTNLNLINTNTPTTNNLPEQNNARIAELNNEMINNTNKYNAEVKKEIKEFNDNRIHEIDKNNKWLQDELRKRNEDHQKYQHRIEGYSKKNCYKKYNKPFATSITNIKLK